MDVRVLQREFFSFYHSLNQKTLSTAIKKDIFAMFSKIKHSMNKAMHQIWSNPSVKTFRIDWLVDGYFTEVEKIVIIIGWKLHLMWRWRFGELIQVKRGSGEAEMAKLWAGRQTGEAGIWGSQTHMKNIN